MKRPARTTRASEPSTLADRDDPDAVTLDGTLGFLRSLWALTHALDKRSKWMLANHGVTGPQRFSIRVIGKVPGVSPSRLARLLHVHPSTVTGVLRRLEENGFVARATDTSDTRRSMLVLTAAGRKLERSNTGSAEACVARVLASYDVDDVRRLETLLHALAVELERGVD